MASVTIESIHQFCGDGFWHKESETNKTCSADYGISDFSFVERVWSNPVAGAITRSVEANPTALIAQPSPDYILSFTIKPLGVTN